MKWRGDKTNRAGLARDCDHQTGSWEGEQSLKWGDSRDTFGKRPGAQADWEQQAGFLSLGGTSR